MDSQVEPQVPPASGQFGVGEVSPGRYAKVGECGTGGRRRGQRHGGEIGVLVQLDVKVETSTPAPIPIRSFSLNASVGCR